MQFKREEEIPACFHYDNTVEFNNSGGGGVEKDGKRINSKMRL